MRSVEIMVVDSQRVANYDSRAIQAARLTQRGHDVSCVNDLQTLANNTSKKFAKKLYSLPHATLQKLDTIQVNFYGVSRRFLAQITRHQNEIKFISSSLQYQLNENADIVIPPEMLVASPNVRQRYVNSAVGSIRTYIELSEKIGHDAAAYTLPQGLRCTFMAVATPLEWKHIISQRVCKRNSLEMQFVMLKLWKAFHALNPELFSEVNMGCSCQTRSCCDEKHMSCGTPYPLMADPSALYNDFCKKYRI